VLAQYAMNLAKLYNSFYTAHRVLGEEGELALARVLLTSCSAMVLENALKLLGIPIPEKM
jgi:arginyl-tRNA synthetase